MNEKLCDSFHILRLEEARHTLELEVAARGQEFGQLVVRMLFPIFFYFIFPGEGARCRGSKYRV